MKILNRTMQGQRIGVLNGAVEFDAQGIAEVTEEQGAELLQIPEYLDASKLPPDGPVQTILSAPGIVPPPPVELPIPEDQTAPVESEVPVIADAATIEKEAAAAVEAAAKAERGRSKKVKE